MTDRLITHLRHIDLAVPDYAKQLDFFTNTWGLTRPSTATPAWPSWPPRVRPSSTSSGCGEADGQADRPDRLRRGERRPTSTRWPPGWPPTGCSWSASPAPLQTPGGGYGFRFFDNEGRTVEISADVAVRAHRTIEEGESIPVRLSHVVINSRRPRRPPGRSTRSTWASRCPTP